MAKVALKSKQSLKVDVVVAQSILEEGGPVKPPLDIKVEIAPSILEEGPTRPPIKLE